MWISALSLSLYSTFKTSPMFENLVDFLETKALLEQNYENGGDIKLQMLVDHFREILMKRNCKINLTNVEWRQVLKRFMVLLVKNYEALPFFGIWRQVFYELKSECENLLQVFKILVMMPFSNTKLERMFSRMLSIKSDLRN